MFPAFLFSRLPFIFTFNFFKKMKVKHIIFFLLLGFFCLISCKKVIIQAGAGNYTSGVFVVNEGPFGGTGSITWHNPETGETVQDVFEKANGGAVLGQFVQSLTLHNGKGYIVVNGANKVYVVDAVSFKYLDTIGGLFLPRFFFPLDDNTALISQWGADGLTGSVAKVDLTTRQILHTIPTGKGPEKMIRQTDGLIAIANSGGFGLDSTLSILNADNTAESNRIVVPGKNPGSLLVAPFATASATYVLCRGYFQDTNPAGWVGPAASVSNPGFVIPPYAEDLVLAPDGQKTYFTAGGKIYVLNGSGLSEFFNQFAYGLGCDPATGNLYCADAKDFNSQGEVVIYSATGTRVGAFSTGVAPGEVVFIR